MDLLLITAALLAGLAAAFWWMSQPAWIKTELGSLESLLESLVSPRNLSPKMQVRLDAERDLLFERERTGTDLRLSLVVRLAGSPRAVADAASEALESAGFGAGTLSLPQDGPLSLRLEMGALRESISLEAAEAARIVGRSLGFGESHPVRVQLFGDLDPEVAVPLLRNLERRSGRFGGFIARRGLAALRAQARDKSEQPPAE